MSNIEQLIEAVQIEGIANRELLSSSVEFEELQLEALFEIKDVLVETRDGLFGYFEIEQQRYKENQLAEIERLRELTGALASGPAGARGDSRPVSATAGATNDGLGVLGTIGGLTVVKSLMGFLPRLLPFLGLFAAGGVIVNLLRNLDKAQTAGSETVGMDVAGDVAGDIYDFAVLPVLSAGLNAMAKEVGYNEEELRKSQEALKGFRTNMELAGQDIFRDLKRFFGEELAGEAAAESEQRIGELRTELREVQQEIIDRGLDASPGGEIETGLARREQIAARLQEIDEAGNIPGSALEQAALASERRELRREQNRLTARLAPVLEEQRIQKEIQQEQERSRLAQAGYEAGDLETPAQREFAGLTSQDKKQYFMDNISPGLQQASETGAIDIDLSRYMANVMNPLTIAGGGAVGIPLDGIDLDKLKTLPPKQLEAILLNDDILLNSGLQVGALPTSDRMVVEDLYRQTTARPFSQPSSQISPTAATLADTPNMIEAGLQPQMAPVPSARSFDASLNGLLNAPLGRASQEISDAKSASPVIVAPSRGGDVVNNNVNQNTTNVISSGSPARTTYQPEHRHQMNMSGGS